MMLPLLLLPQKQKRSEAPSMKLDDAQDTAVDLLILVQGRRNSSVGRPLRWKVVVATSMIELEEEEEAELLTQ